MSPMLPEGGLTVANDLEKRRQVAEAAARAAGAVHLRYYQTGIDYEGKHGDRRDGVADGHG